MTRLWTNQNGWVVCAQHGGNALEASVAAYPNDPFHRTDLDFWTPWPDELAAETGIDCDDCTTPKKTPNPETKDASMTTKITGLTASNYQALHHTAELDPTALPIAELRKTVVVFTVDAATARDRLQDAMDRRRATYGGRDHIYRSLIAVRNKLTRIVTAEAANR